MTRTYIVGTGMTRFGKFLDRSVKDLTHEAVGLALADAGAAHNVVERAFFSNATQAAIEGQFTIAGQIALRAAGFSEIPIVNVENACASGSTALHLAHTALLAGQAEVVLAVGAEKMYHVDKARSFAVFEGGWDVHSAQETTAALLALGVGTAMPAEAQPPGQRSIFMEIYASLAKFHMKMFGTTQEDIAAVSAKNHQHSVHNPLSQYREAMSVEQVLGARVVSWPLTLPMCSPISDGAAAVLLCSETALERFDRRRAVRVLASVLASGTGRDAGQIDRHITHLAAKRAYEAASLGPQDMDVAEVHDASAFAEIQQIESLGFCGFGEGGRLTRSGATALGGRIPVNPSGGLESKGHPIGVTGLAQICELVAQLRGECGRRQVPGARRAIAENGGGFIGIEEAAACITILEHDA